MSCHPPYHPSADLVQSPAVAWRLRGQRKGPVWFWSLHSSCSPSAGSYPAWLTAQTSTPLCPSHSLYIYAAPEDDRALKLSKLCIWTGITFLASMWSLWTIITWTLSSSSRIKSSLTLMSSASFLHSVSSSEILLLRDSVHSPLKYAQKNKTRTSERDRHSLEAVYQWLRQWHFSQKCMEINGLECIWCIKEVRHEINSGLALLTKELVSC